MSFAAAYVPVRSTSTNTIHPLLQFVASVGTTMAFLPRFIASPRAALTPDKSVLVKEVNSALRWYVVKLGTATVSKMATNAMVTISSIRVKPFLAVLSLFISSKRKFWCQCKFLYQY